MQLSKRLASLGIVGAQSKPSEHYSTMILGGLRGASNVPYYAEGSQYLGTICVNFPVWVCNIVIFVIAHLRGAHPSAQWLPPTTPRYHIAVMYEGFRAWSMIH